MRLMELKEKEKNTDDLILRMGVRNGGCSGLSYSMDFSTEAEIQEDDAVDEYPEYGVKCVVDAKSMLYLYGMELDYSDELIGGGFKFFNPNAEESCGCGSSFGATPPSRQSTSDPRDAKIRALQSELNVLRNKNYR